MLTCQYCKRTGFVRFETVVTKGHTYRHYYCGVCNRTWQIDDDTPAPPPDPPDSKRRRPIKRSDD